MNINSTVFQSYYERITQLLKAQLNKRRYKICPCSFASRIIYGLQGGGGKIASYIVQVHLWK
jgi:hypothetical protein